MLIYVTLGILILLTVASIREVIVGAREYDCDCEDVHKIPRSGFHSLIVYGLFVLPLAMGFLMPDKILGSAMAENLGVTLLSSDARKLAQVSEAVSSPKPADSGQAESGGEEPPEQQPTPQPDSGKQAASAGAGTSAAGSSAPLDDEAIRQTFADSGLGEFYTDIAVFLYKQPVINLDDKVFLDGLTVLELYAKEFAGKELETVGFVYHQPEFSPEQFVVARFFVIFSSPDGGGRHMPPAAHDWPIAACPGCFSDGF